MIISNCNDCAITIQTDYSVEKEELYSFPYLNSTTINLIYKVDSLERETLAQVFVNQHHLETIDEEEVQVPEISQFEFPQDGLYKVLNVIVPNKQWVVDYLTEHETNAYDIYDKVLVYDEGKLFIYSQSGYTEIDVDYLNEFNTDNNKISIYKEEEYTFSKCKLRHCFYEINKELFAKICGKCANESDLIYKRDLLWMAFNIIDYLLEKGLLLKAQEVIEQFMSCAGFCNQTNEVGGTGCGCNRHDKE